MWLSHTLEFLPAGTAEVIMGFYWVLTMFAGIGVLLSVFMPVHAGGVQGCIIFLCGIGVCLLWAGVTWVIFVNPGLAALVAIPPVVAPLDVKLGIYAFLTLFAAFIVLLPNGEGRDAYSVTGKLCSLGTVAMWLFVTYRMWLV